MKKFASKAVEDDNEEFLTLSREKPKLKRSAKFYIVWNAAYILFYLVNMMKAFASEGVCLKSILLCAFVLTYSISFGICFGTMTNFKAAKRSFKSKKKVLRVFKRAMKLMLLGMTIYSLIDIFLGGGKPDKWAISLAVLSALTLVLQIFFSAVSASIRRRAGKIADALKNNIRNLKTLIGDDVDDAALEDNTDAAPQPPAKCKFRRK